ncbi:MAG: hypothetical protein F6J95_019005 [Leptolyngbya sp. SIO1E4]|nr:hypothetical protein [Leptolyngbya sp. SIO1E4]
MALLLLLQGMGTHITDAGRHHLPRCLGPNVECRLFVWPTIRLCGQPVGTANLLSRQGYSGLPMVQTRISLHDGYLYWAQP